MGKRESKMKKKCNLISVEFLSFPLFTCHLIYVPKSYIDKACSPRKQYHFFGGRILDFVELTQGVAFFHFAPGQADSQAS